MIATSSSTIMKSEARFRSASQTALLTSSRFVSSDSALYCATTALTTSEPIDGKTLSSQSRPKFCNVIMYSQQQLCRVVEGTYNLCRTMALQLLPQETRAMWCAKLSRSNLQGTVFDSAP